MSNTITRALTATAVATGLAGAAFVGTAIGHALPSNCVSQPWGFLGSQTRQLCDDPIRADGSWLRNRIVGRAGYYQYAHSQCSYGTYSGGCTYYPAGWVAEYHSDDEWYIVTPDTILPDEPGHIGA